MPIYLAKILQLTQESPHMARESSAAMGCWKATCNALHECNCFNIRVFKWPAKRIQILSTQKALQIYSDQLLCACMCSLSLFLLKSKINYKSTLSHCCVNTFLTDCTRNVLWIIALISELYNFQSPCALHKLTKYQNYQAALKGNFLHFVEYDYSSNYASRGSNC